MQTPATLRLLACAAAAAVLFGRSPVACAEDVPYRFGLVGVVGGGMAGVVHAGPLPSFIGFTDLGVEFLGERRPWGGFLRGEFLSSGDGGRWTAFAVSVGTEYRLFGGDDRTALFLRGGVSYERWTGAGGGCPIALVVPSSCNNLNIDPNHLMPPPFRVTTDTLGVIGGLRVELPLAPVYIAFSLNVLPSVAVDQSNPAGVFQLRLDLEAGFREARRAGQGDAVRAPDGTRLQSDSTTPFAR
jgi:hypothetical protein